MDERPGIDDHLAGWAYSALRDCLADSDLPIVDRDRGIAVIRLDPELAGQLRVRCEGYEQGWVTGHYCGKCVPCRAARIIGGELA